MKSVHPFPARMAPEILDDLLNAAPKGAVVLDPMCGSGTVVRKALSSGCTAIGLDSDPLAVLMTSVATRKLNEELVKAELKSILIYVRRHQKTLCDIHDCDETNAFIRFWFAPKQRRQLNAIAKALKLAEKNRKNQDILNLFKLALSRTIITKDKGASLAADVSHSRPHKVRDKNDYDVVANFERITKLILTTVNSAVITGTVNVQRDDARKLSTLSDSSIDVIVTSPPYLNALDYVRGHKLALVWLGKTIPELRELRSNNIGAESAPQKALIQKLPWETVLQKFPSLAKLTKRQQGMTHRYVLDLLQICSQFNRVMKHEAKLHTVVGNSTLGSVYVPNSALLEFCGKKFGFRLEKEVTREIPENRRYLPISGKIGSLSKRMRQEVIQTFVLQKN